MEQDHSACEREIAKALSKFQFLEEGIRVYLGSTYLLIAKRLEGQLVIRFSQKDLERKPLGSLLREFKKFCQNDNLISEIRKLIDDRNMLAHKGFYVMYQHLVDETNLNELEAKARRTADKAESCILEVAKEIDRVEATYRDYLSR